MTNFAFLMDLLKISAKNFLSLGFDHTLVSRWRTGKRRIMPGRSQAAAIARIFRDADALREHPVIDRLLEIQYPTQPCAADDEKQALLERFLTEKGQTDADYQKKREVRLGCLQNHTGISAAAPRGIDAVRLGLLDFLDLIGELPQPQEFSFVFTEGLSIYLDDASFGNLFITKLMKLFEAGHRMCSIMRSDSTVSDSWYFHKIKLYAHLEGYIGTLYYNDFMQQGSEKILCVAGDKLALTVSREVLWDVNDTCISIYYDTKSAKEVSERIEEYRSRAHMLAHYEYFDRPNGWFAGIDILRDQPSYLFSRLPHFGISAPDDFAESFALSHDEMETIWREFYPLALDIRFFDEGTPIRHVFCESDIEDALMKQRHQSHELTAMLGRKAWMPTRSLVRQLTTIQALLKERKNYEVCFLSKERFDGLLVQIGVWGNEAAVSWIEKKQSVSCKNYMIVSGMQSLCVTAWNEIPAEMRTRSAATRKLNRWVRIYRI